MMMDTAPRTASSSVDEMMTTVLLLDGALGDMVAVSTPRTAADGDEGVWQTVRRVESHPQDDLNLWWSVDAGYLLDDDVGHLSAAGTERSVKRIDHAISSDKLWSVAQNLDDAQ
jgi:hypothetical protein